MKKKKVLHNTCRSVKIEWRTRQQETLLALMTDMSVCIAA
jgi:hypothetical protein